MPALAEIPQLAALLETAGNEFNPAATRPEYDASLDQWRLYLDLYELDANRLSALVDKHSDTEDAGKYKLRQALSAVYNLVPTIVNLSRNYIFSDDPTITAENPVLQAFIDDCDGNGLPLAEFVKSIALPQSQVFGFADVVVSHPNTSGEEFRTAADVAAARLKPHVVAYTPIDRVNWSCSPDGGYNWTRYRDVGDEGLNPFAPVQDTEAFVTLAIQEQTDQPAYWVRSANHPTDDGQGGVANKFDHEADFCPTRRVPVATLFYQRSIDRQRRRDAISKISTIAILTKQIIQILSWTTEDVLANLAVLGLPTNNGKVPTKEDGSPAITSLGVFSYLCYPKDSSHAPAIIQGDVSHIDVKIKLVELHLREILRVANLMVTAGDANTTSSGIQAVVERNELFRELKDTAASLDAFTLEILALAASWIENKDISAIDIKDVVQVDYHKGPFTVEPLAEVINNASTVIGLFRDLSPTGCEAMLKQVARAGIVGDDAALAETLEELKGSGNLLPVGTNSTENPSNPTEQEAVETLEAQA